MPVLHNICSINVSKQQKLAIKFNIITNSNFIRTMGFYVISSSQLFTKIKSQITLNNILIANVFVWQNYCCL